MSQKTAIMWGMIIGSIIGGYIPTFFGASFFSFAAIFWNGVGAMIGVIIAYKLTS
jgi:uncharacterized membrane protein YeaQ/YmgE (transglycosylase-associated protein family)